MIRICNNLFEQGRLEIAPFGRSHASSYRRSIVTMALSCVTFEIKRDVCRKLRVFHTPVFRRRGRGSRRNIVITFGLEKLEWWATRWWKTFDNV